VPETGIEPYVKENEMGLKEFFRTIQWRATLQVAAIRIVVAAVLWPLLMLATGSLPPADFIPMALSLMVGFSAFIAIAIPAIGLARANVPFVGFAALPAWLVVIADPLVKVLHSVKPEWVPVERFKFVNPPVLAIFGEPEDVAMQSPSAADFGMPNDGLRRNPKESGLFRNLPSSEDKS
jgi:hypothetical protein